MKINEFFDRIEYLNLASRPERDNRMKQELAKWEIEATRFEAIPNDNAQASFNLSCCAMLDAFLKSSAERFLSLEDDVVFTRDLRFVGRSLNELKNMDFSLLYLGGNLFSFPFEHYSKHLIRVSGVWCTHAVAYTRAGARAILDNFDPLGPYIYDDFLAQYFLSKIQPPAYMTNPIVAVQDPGFSDLMKSEVDYTVCWNNTRVRMMKRSSPISRR